MFSIVNSYESRLFCTHAHTIKILKLGKTFHSFHLTKVRIFTDNFSVFLLFFAFFFDCGYGRCASNNQFNVTELEKLVSKIPEWMCLWERMRNRMVYMDVYVYCSITICNNAINNMVVQINRVSHFTRCMYIGKIMLQNMLRSYFHLVL